MQFKILPNLFKYIILHSFACILAWPTPCILLVPRKNIKASYECLKSHEKPALLRSRCHRLRRPSRSCQGPADLGSCGLPNANDLYRFGVQILDRFDASIAIERQLESHFSHQTILQHRRTRMILSELVRTFQKILQVWLDWEMTSQLNSQVIH